MTKVISSQTSNAKYFLTIENGVATDCTCPDRVYRHHECKHMRQFNAEVLRAATFLALKRRIAQAEREARRAAYLYFELAMGIN